MLDNMLHVFVCLGQNVGNSKNGSNPDEVGIGDFHSMNRIVQIYRSNCSSEGYSVKERSRGLRNSR